jgi:ubiquinone/menaquinone biosynthesis C-methylase UbiE/uncharacterized protein YbaR (Trm112 family)
MFYKIITKLQCPNTETSDLSVYAIEVLREGQIIQQVSENDLLPTDDIKSGLLFSKNKKYVYPIYEFIPILLNDSDNDLHHLNEVYQYLAALAPNSYQPILSENFERIKQHNNTSDGNWNREEMKYYDAAVETPELRTKMLHSIQKDNLWRLFIPRKQKMINPLSFQCKNHWIFEIGCGNARTVARMFNPNQFQYHYIGTDISFKRLMVAKMAIPNADFIQASALNIPLKDHAFNSAISFGMLHHLPRPSEALHEVDKKLMTEGLFALHEPVYTSRKFTESQTAFVRKIFRTYDHSDHDNKIHLKETISELKKCKHNIESVVPYNSIFRVVFEAIMNRTFKTWQKSKLLVSTVLFLDNLLLHTIVKLSNKLGPQAIIIVSKKQ